MNTWQLWHTRQKVSLLARSVAWDHSGPSGLIGELLLWHPVQAPRSKILMIGEKWLGGKKHWRCGCLTWKMKHLGSPAVSCSTEKTEPCHVSSAQMDLRSCLRAKCTNSQRICSLDLSQAAPDQGLLWRGCFVKSVVPSQQGFFSAAAQPSLAFYKYDFDSWIEMEFGLLFSEDDTQPLVTTTLCFEPNNAGDISRFSKKSSWFLDGESWQLVESLI